MKITNKQKADIELKANQLLKVKEELKKEFFGIDEIIDQIVDSIEAWYLFPDSCFKPCIINLWGMTGCGKTAVVKKIVELLNYRQYFINFDMGEFAAKSYNSFNNYFDEDAKHLDEKPVIICLDEFQHIRTIDENGTEKDQYDNRKVWELIDTGYLEYYNHSRYGFCEGINQLKIYLNTMLNRNIEVVNGIVTKGEDEFIKFLEEGREKYNFRNDYYWKAKENKRDKKPVYFIPRTYYSDFFDLVSSEFKDFFEFEGYILSLNGKESIKFLNKIIKLKELPKSLNLRKSLIFIVGNLDEAYVMSHDMDPDENPDVLHEFSSKITLTNIKKVLRARFRQEQIARLGNNHIIYPAFNSATFKAIIQHKLNKFSLLVKEKYDIDLEFDSSVNEIIFKEGVFPTLGARPVFTTINLLIESNFTKIIGDIFKLKIDVEKIIWMYTDSKFIIELLSKDNIKIHTLCYDVHLRLDNLRISTNDDKQALIAVHESGHAIVSSLRTRILPREIISVSADSEIGGKSVGDLPFNNLPTKETFLFCIESLLSGYVAERLIFGENNTTAGVNNDIKRATELASEMIQQYGMGKNRFRIGVNYSGESDIVTMNKSHQEEVKSILITCEKTAEEILQKNKVLLLKMAEYLSTHTKIERAGIKELFMKYADEEWARRGEFITKEEFYGFKKMLSEQLSMLN
ncbi:AAA family ATPase [Bacteroidetes/Chlorobi group bacterium ChocPot_Mid]|nr:MAG: AAA family ATPase [Bacteroidetes/Chlorobi group bacterium ChocPot_Mid]